MSAKASDGPATQPIGVFVLDDQEIVRRGVRASGQSLLNSRAASKVMARLLDGPGQPDPLARLTPHEYSVLTLIGEGLTNPPYENYVDGDGGFNGHRADHVTDGDGGTYWWSTGQEVPYSKVWWQFDLDDATAPE